MTRTTQSFVSVVALVADDAARLPAFVAETLAVLAANEVG